MEPVKNYKELLQRIHTEPYLLVYCESPACSVCHADRPRVEQLAAQLQFPAVAINLATNPAAVGQLSLYVAPAVLLYHHAREYHRQARIIDFAELKKRMEEIKKYDS